jgi:hypothetical protein
MEGNARSLCGRRCGVNTKKRNAYDDRGPACAAILGDARGASDITGDRSAAAGTENGRQRVGGMRFGGAREVSVGGRPTPIAVWCHLAVDFADCHLSIFEITKDPIGVPGQTVGFVARTHFPKRVNSGPPSFFH